jgi:glycine/D-amino acid oxidase-like deaminating enzyme
MNLSPLPWPPFGASPWPAPAPPPTSPLPSHADVAIVGAGVTGLSAALVLATEGRDAIVLDRAFGDGAACRSGGIIIGDTLVGPAEGFDRCEEDLRAWVDAHDVRGGLRWCGCLELDRDLALPLDPIDWRDDGVVRVNRIVAGGVLDPAGLVERLAGEACARGARFVNGAAVTSIARGRRGIDIDTSLGRLDAERVLVTTDATSLVERDDPWPVRLTTIVIETTPPTDVQLDRAGVRERRPFYTNDLPLLWGRLLPSKGLLVGRELIRGTSHDAVSLARAMLAASLRLIARVRGLHPAFVDLEIARVWSGPIARDDRGVPAIHADPEIDGVLWAGGYGGHGLAPAFRLGAMAARALIR